MRLPIQQVLLLVLWGVSLPFRGASAPRLHKRSRSQMRSYAVAVVGRTWESPSVFLGRDTQAEARCSRDARATRPAWPRGRCARACSLPGLGSSHVVDSPRASSGFAPLGAGACVAPVLSELTQKFSVSRVQILSPTRASAGAFSLGRCLLPCKGTDAVQGLCHTVWLVLQPPCMLSFWFVFRGECERSPHDHQLRSRVSHTRGHRGVCGDPRSHGQAWPWDSHVRDHGVSPACASYITASGRVSGRGTAEWKFRLHLFSFFVFRVCVCADSDAFEEIQFLHPGERVPKVQVCFSVRSSVWLLMCSNVSLTSCVPASTST